MSFNVSTPVLSGSPATLAPVSQPDLLRRPRRRQSGAAGSLAAQGEPLVWLTGGALVVAIAMIVALLAFILVEGLSTFWPLRVLEVKTADGKTWLGEVSSVETFKPSAETLAALAPGVRDSAKRELAANHGAASRTLLRTGNFELTNTDANWIEQYQVQEQSQPEWAVVFERLTWGRFYGTPIAFVLDGKQVATTPADSWAKLNEFLGPVHDRFQRRVALEQHDIGAISRRQKAADLAVVQAELSSGKDSAAHATAVAEDAQVQAAAAKDKAQIEHQIQKLNRENAQYVLQVKTAQGQTIDMPVEQIVRAYPANQLGFWGKVGVYLSRWREFLFDDPREANSEGGVFPAIWGTIAMTLILSALVVPFGVLAALYLREYAKRGFLVSAVRIAINNLAGVPSIVFGVFGLGFFCYKVGGWMDTGADVANRWSAGGWWSGVAGLAGLTALGLFCAYRTVQNANTAAARRAPSFVARIGVAAWLSALVLAVLLISYSPFFEGFFRAKSVAEKAPTFGTGGILWASLTLALLTLPVVIVATEEALAAVPKSMREGSYACGASKWQTIWRIVLPRALPGIMTGMILAMARGAGEVAPLMLVGVQKIAKDLPVDAVFPFIHPERSFMHLGFHIYDVGMQSRNSEAGKPMVFTTTLLLITIVAALNIAAVWLRGRLRRKFVANHF